MTSTVFAFVERIAVYIAGIAATLATVSGCVAAVERGTETFGAIPRRARRHVHAGVHRHGRHDARTSDDPERRRSRG